MNGFALGTMACAQASAPALTLPTTNLLAAYDARSFVSLDGGITCSTWTDISGNGWHATQANAGERAAISTVDGYASLLFDGSNDSYNVSGISASAGHKTVYAVQKQSVFGGYRALFDTSAGRMFAGILISGNIGVFDTTDRASGISAASARSRITFTTGGGSSRCWRGATAGTSTAWGANSAIGGTTNICEGSAGGLNFGGHVHQLCIYGATRDTAVEDYLTQEWGV